MGFNRKAVLFTLSESSRYVIQHFNSRFFFLSSNYGLSAVLDSGYIKIEQDRIPDLKSLTTQSERTHKNDSNIAAMIEVSKKYFSYMNNKVL